MGSGGRGGEGMLQQQLGGSSNWGVVAATRGVDSTGPYF